MLKTFLICILFILITYINNCGVRTHIEASRRATYFYENSFYKNIIQQNPETIQPGVIFLFNYSLIFQIGDIYVELLINIMQKLVKQLIGTLFNI
jgi:hypothetical protein